MWPFKRKENIIKHDWVFFGLRPCRDKKLDCLSNSICPDCNSNEFVIKNVNEVYILECCECKSSFALAPTEFMRYSK
jgi:transcription elongation factor Elf1